MCGIAGVLSVDGRGLDPRLPLEAMRDTLCHRGPDDEGAWRSADGQIALAHRRLSIVDLSPLGRNPMAWDDGRLVITFNGEIYNFLELRAELEREGARFRSHTDTEVILAAYDRWGLSCVDRLAGMFAFALWDARRHRLWLVRDRLGKKPIYYSLAGGALRFGSELKALLADPAVDRRLDPRALRMYLRYGYVPAPLTIFEGISKLEPAHALVCEHGQLSVRRYWDPLEHVDRHADLSDGDAEAALEGLLDTAVRQRQIADVPLGAFLSGGIDSSLIVALMQERSRTRVKTFTIRFEDPAFDEADHALAVARHLGTEHTEQMCTAADLLSVVDRIPAMFDEPFGDSSAIPTLLVSAAARSQVTVALSGDGGDELFFGYPRYASYANASWLLDLPRPVRLLGAAAARRLPGRRLRRAADVLSAADPDGYARFVAWTDQSDIRRLTGVDADDAPLYTELRQRLDRVPDIERPPLLDLVSYLTDDILTKVDRASMAVSLEVRAPLLDHRVVEFAVGLPMRLKRRDGRQKWLLRRLLAKRVPPSLTDRPKMGFGVPLETWLRGPLRERMTSYVDSSIFDDLGIDGRAVRTQWSAFTGGAPRRPDTIWQLFVLAAWADYCRPAAASPSA
ncbi:MAG: asparagine synthase (glutamine-hydrolyzing) [Vicinamibacterales bacterium]